MNSKHVKPTPITAEQYLWVLLDKHTVRDPLEDILKQLEKQTNTIHPHNQSKELKDTKNGTYTNDTLHESMTINNNEDSSQTTLDYQSVKLDDQAPYLATFFVHLADADADDYRLEWNLLVMCFKGQ